MGFPRAARGRCIPVGAFEIPLSMGYKVCYVLGLSMVSNKEMMVKMCLCMSTARFSPVMAVVSVWLHTHDHESGNVRLCLKAI